MIFQLVFTQIINFIKIYYEDDDYTKVIKLT